MIEHIYFRSVPSKLQEWNQTIPGFVGSVSPAIIRRMQKEKVRFWTRDSSVLLGGFLAAIFLIVYSWWPLAQEDLA